MDDARAGAGGARRRPSTRVGTAGRRVKFLYTIPNFHNPAGVTMAVGRRPVIARDLPPDAGIAILEDNPYGLLGFDDTLYRAIRADDT